MGCGKSEQPYKTVHIQLEDARIATREKTQNTLDCLRKNLERDTLKSDTAFADLYYRLIKVIKTRDSLITTDGQTTKQFIEKLEIFKRTIMDIHNPGYIPDKLLEPNFIHEIDLIRAELHLLPSEIHNELLNCILERWTNECFKSLFQQWAIDEPC